MARPGAGPLNLHEGMYHATMAARAWIPITPNDSTDVVDLAEVTNENLGVPRGIMTDDGGDVAIRDVFDNDITVPTNAYEVNGDFSPTRVLSTGTTANQVYLIY